MNDQADGTAPTLDAGAVLRALQELTEGIRETNGRLERLEDSEAGRKRLTRQQSLPPIVGGDALPPTAERGIVNRRDRSGFEHFDGETNEVFDSTIDALMFRPDLLNECPCGEVRYVMTFRVEGGRDIRDAQRAQVVMSGDRTGEIIRSAAQFVNDPLTGDCLVPEELRPTDEKTAHLLACTEEATGAQRAQLRAALAAKADKLDSATEIDHVVPERLRVVRR